jgi:uncharacterized protein YqjF (DUF2071 family)
MLKEMPSTEERLAGRTKPDTSPIMHQTWGKLLFMHWTIPAGILRGKIPACLEIDTYEDQAWIGITPFTMWNVRAVAVPPIPGLNAFHECNVRTYVHLDGVAGVWFLSLDINKTIPALAARLFYELNYLKATIDLCQVGRAINYSLKRPPQNQSAAASLEAAWEIGDSRPEAAPESLEFFLTERYCLYGGNAGRLLRARIWHVPWSLHSAKLNALRSTMIASHGLPEPEGPPLLHYAEERDVLIWPPEEV